MLFGVEGHICDNDFVMCGSIFLFMYQTNCIYIGFQLVLNMLTYVAPSSGRYTEYYN